MRDGHSGTASRGNTRNTGRFAASAEHPRLTRRGFLGGMASAGAAAFAADMTALNVLGSPDLAAELLKNQKRCIMLWLAGGASQLETFDPKPGAATGGPFRSIRVWRLEELLPR